MTATKQQIDEFLASFDNDIDAAVLAIRSRAPVLDSMLRPAANRPPRALAERVVISANHLDKEYSVGHQKIHAVRDISFDIHAGEFVAITAPSGSGKSTLLQLLGGLEKPTTGSVSVNGANLNSMSDRKLSQFRGQTIGFVFQFFYLQPFLNLERNLEVPGMFARTQRRQRQAKAQELAEIVGIADRLRHYPKELSGGQIQRAAIVRALLNSPEVILADEPTGNLDSKNAAGIIDLFERVRDEFGTTIVVATHDLSIARRADRIINLQDGGLA